MYDRYIRKPTSINYGSALRLTNIINCTKLGSDGIGSFLPVSGRTSVLPIDFDTHPQYIAYPCRASM
jgi:hypothetical protein